MRTIVAIIGLVMIHWSVYGLTPTDSIAITKGGNPSCPGDTITFTVYPTNGGATPSYLWRVNGIAYGTNSATFTTTTLSNGDTVTCVMTASGGGGTATSNKIGMNVKTATIPSITVKGDTLTSSFSTGNQWYKNGKLISGATGQVYIATQTGSYRVYTTNGNGCVTISTAQGINYPLVTVSITQIGGSNPACAGDTLTYVASSTNAGANPLYQWQINGATAGTNSDTFRTTSVSNGQIVLLHLTPAGGYITTSNAITMTIHTLPATPTISYVGSVLTSSALTGNQWYLNSIAQADTTRRDTVLQSGTYTVITHNNFGCYSHSSLPLVANIGVTIAVIAGGNPSCQGDTVTFRATPVFGGFTPSYQWQVNGVNVGINSITYKDGGLVTGDTVTCTMTTTVGVSVTSPKITITVNALPPIPTFSTNVNILTSSSPTGNQWYRNNVLLNGANQQVYTAIQTGTYTVIVTNVAGCHATSASQTITVNDTFVNINQVIYSKPPCVGDTATFAAIPNHGGSNPTYQWMAKGVAVAGNKDTIRIGGLVAVDTVTCIMTPTGGGTPVVSNFVLPIFTPPPPPATITINGLTMTSSYPTGNQWYVNDSIIIGAVLDTDSAVVTGNYTVIYTDTNGCKSKSLPVFVSVAPHVTIAITSGTNPSCIYSPVTFTATPINGGSSPSYLWQVNGVGVSSGKPIYTTTNLSNGASVRCIMTPAGASPVFSNDIKMTVLPPPAIPTLSYISGVIYSSKGTSYQWYYNGSLIVGATTSAIVPTQTGSYIVAVANVAGCSTSSFPLHLIVTGVAEPTPMSPVTLYPSPNSGEFHIHLPKESKTTLTITDLIGRAVYSGTLTHTENEIKMGEIVPQLYIAKIRSEGMNISIPFEVR